MNTVQAQDDLFASENSPESVDISFARTRRIVLDAESWLDVVTGWLSSPQALLERLTTVIPWREHDRVVFNQTFREPRMTAHYPKLSDVPESMLVDAASALSAHYRITYDGLWMNLYRSGQDSTGWHGDRPCSRLSGCTVPVLTLGAARRFQVKPRTGGRSITLKPVSGDLIVMGGRCQCDWLHGVPKEPAIPGARISVNFQSASQGGSGSRHLPVAGQAVSKE